MFIYIQQIDFYDKMNSFKELKVQMYGSPRIMIKTDFFDGSHEWFFFIWGYFLNRVSLCSSGWAGQPRLASNWLQYCLNLLSGRITGAHHSAWFTPVYLNLLYKQDSREPKNHCVWNFLKKRSSELIFLKGSMVRKRYILEIFGQSNQKILG